MTSDMRPLFDDESIHYIDDQEIPGARPRYIWTRLFYSLVGAAAILTSLTQLDQVPRMVHVEVARMVEKEFGADADERVDMAKLQAVKEQLVRVTTVLLKVSAGIGMGFVVLAILMGAFPLVTNLLGLILYIAISALFLLQLASNHAEFNPAIVIGLGIRVLIVIGLVRSVAAAIRRQQAEARVRLISS